MSEAKRPTVGFIGLGNMGAPMAANLQKAGYRLVVNDTREEAGRPLIDAGAAWADTPRAVALQCDVIFTCLPSLHAIEAVALGQNGILSGARAGLAFFETSTNSPDLLKRLYAAFAEKGAHVLDAPVSGGVTGAERARLAMWVGGDKETFQRYEPVLQTMSQNPVHIGESGAGLVTKLVNNCVTFTMHAAIGEVFAMGVKAGAEPLALWRAIRQGIAGRQRSFDGLATRYLTGEFDDKGAPLRIIYKDMMIATELARELHVPMRMADIALADVQQAINRGWADRDARSPMLLPQERIGVKIAVDPADIAEVLRQDPPAPSDLKYGTS
jgi:3-hydroxyisobutyrate dehydrogenase-like beta-hydroxyacid dehydrogenase